MWTYDEGWINARVGPTFLALYQQAGRVIDDDPGYAVWPSRVLADIYSMNMDPEASLAKARRRMCRATHGAGSHRRGRRVDAEELLQEQRLTSCRKRRSCGARAG